MRKFPLSVIVVLAALIVVMTSGRAGAATDMFTYEKLTYMTFNGAVQIPWATLPPGTYRFRLTNPGTSRNVLQVLSDDGSIVYSMFHTIPDYRSITTEESVVTFRETPAGTPAAVKSLFYGGETRGYEFIYPKETFAIAPSWPQPEITYTPIETPAVAEPIEIEEPLEPALEPELLAEVEPAALPAPLEVQEPAAPSLPKTASPLPFVALGGLASFVLGVGSRLARRRVRAD